jgi:hypothetical protein
MPSSEGTPPMGNSPAAVASGNPGANAGAVAKIREAVKIISQALPELPVGSSMQMAVSKAVTALSKEFPESEAAPGMQQTALRDLAAQAQKQQVLRALMRQQQMSQSSGAPEGAPAEQPQAA